MTRATRIPPGRSGRMWLRRRLATARRGREQLDRKLRILVPELERRRLLAAACAQAWAEACEVAETWQLRATLLGGEDAIRGAAAATPVDVDVHWAVTMGVAYPAETRVVTPAGPAPGPVANAAVAPAVAAFETALAAGVRSAAAEEAVRRVESEVAVTRRRLRALDKRWLPWLEQSLAELELSLEQAEQEEGARLRLASAAGAGGRAER